MAFSELPAMSACRVWGLLAVLWSGLASPLYAAQPQITKDQNDWAVRAAARSQSRIAGLPVLASLTPRARPAQSAARIALGRKLFFDRRLSLNGTMSCGMCHVPEQAFTSNEVSVAIGMNGRSARRNAPTLVNVAFYQLLFQDGRDSALETQFFSPLLAANEMANPSVGYVIDKVRRLPGYQKMFKAAFGSVERLITPDRIGLAFAAYQRTLIAGASRFDQWHFGGDPLALTSQEKHGFELFTGEAGCAQCHRLATDHAVFTDQLFHDTGYGWMREQLRQHPPKSTRVELAPGQTVLVAAEIINSVGLAPREDLGRYEVTLQPVDLWRFRTPQLRNIALTAPYMHDGGLRTLTEVLQFYNRGGEPHAAQSRLLRPLGLHTHQLQALEAFLRALTSPGMSELVAEARVLRPDSPAD